MTVKDQLRNKAGGNIVRLQNITPMTGIGRFDAAYDFMANTLEITLRVFFEWNDRSAGKRPWTAKEQLEFRNRFKQVNEQTWSDCYTLAVDKDNARDMYARVKVRVEEATSPAVANYTVNVSNNLKTESNVGMHIYAQQKVMLSMWDVYLEERLSRDQGALWFKIEQFTDALASTHAEFIPFDTDSSKLGTNVMPLNMLAGSARNIISKDMADSEFTVWVYGKATAAESKKTSNMLLGKNRAKAVKEYLERALPFKTKVKVVDSADKEAWAKPKIDAILQAKNYSALDRQARAFGGVMLLVKNTGDKFGTDTLKKGLNRNYIVAAHETGHMFGLPDEYFGCNCLGIQQEVDMLTHIPKAVENLTKYSDKNPGSQSQNEAFTKLLRVTKIPSPLFMNSKNAVTTSIMYAGSDVLPAHYLTFWYAMLKLTYPIITPLEWKIVPNAMGEGKKSNVNLFGR